MKSTDRQSAQRVLCHEHRRSKRHAQLYARAATMVLQATIGRMRERFDGRHGNNAARTHEAHRGPSCWQVHRQRRSNPTAVRAQSTPPYRGPIGPGQSPALMYGRCPRCKRNLTEAEQVQMKCGQVPEASAGAADAAGMSHPAIPPILPDDIDQATCEPSAGRRPRLAQRPPASARSPPAVQSALDRAVLAGHSYARSSGSPSESEE